MKHKSFRWIPAVLLAALLADCGAETAPPASAAAKPAGSKQPAVLTATPAEPDSMMESETVLETENAETLRITEQISLEKMCDMGYTTISVHLPKLDTVRATLTRISKYGDTTTETRTGVLTRGSVGFAFEGECWQLRCLRSEDENYKWAIALREDGTMTMADMGGNAEYSYISWMDLRRS